MTTTPLTPTLGDITGMAAAKAIRNIHTATWGTIQSFDSNTCMATVQPVPYDRRPDATGAVVAQPQSLLQNVRVCFPGCGAVYMSWKPNVGDFVVVLFMEQAMDAWHQTGGTGVDPGDDRRMSRNDAIAIPLHVEAGVTISDSALIIDGPRVDIGSDSLDPLQDGVLTGQTICPFLGTPFYATGGASTKVLAKK